MDTKELIKTVAVIITEFARAGFVDEVQEFFTKFQHRTLDHLMYSKLLWSRTYTGSKKLHKIHLRLPTGLTITPYGLKWNGGSLKLVSQNDTT